MEQFDMEKLEKAIIYVDRIADGKNPVTNVLAEDDLVMNDPNIIRCMFFIKEALKAIKDNGGFVGRVPEIKKKDFPVEKLASFKFEENKTITKFVDQINEGINGKEYNKITFKVITNWLKKNGYLEEVEDEELGKKVTLSTEKGQNIGISHSLQTTMRGQSYYRIIYDKNAQTFVINHLTEMVADDKDETIED